jgi:hypothetical protein
MTTMISDLEMLEDIIDTLVFEDEPTIFSDDHAIEMGRDSISSYGRIYV